MSIYKKGRGWDDVSMKLIRAAGVKFIHFPCPFNSLLLILFLPLHIVMPTKSVPLHCLNFFMAFYRDVALFARLLTRHAVSGRADGCLKTGVLEIEFKFHELRRIIGLRILLAQDRQTNWCLANRFGNVRVLPPFFLSLFIIFQTRSDCRHKTEVCWFIPENKQQRTCDGISLFIHH